MKPIYFILFICLMACRTSSVQNQQQLSREIWSADSTMSALAADLGFNTAVLRFADSSIVKLSEGKLPIIGIHQFATSFDAAQDIKSIAWTPQFADVAASGELGYTWGNWTLNLPDTNYYGKYFTVWKKNNIGEWKVVLDGGNSSPAPGQ